MKLSIIISSHNRSNLFRRCLYWINRNRPSCKFEVIVADDNSTEREEILIQLNRYNFPWKFIDVDTKIWEEKTGLKVYAGNPSLTNNIAFQCSTGNLVSLVGNECIVYDEYDKIIKEFEYYNNENTILFTTTYDINLSLDDDGKNLPQQLTPQIFKKPLQSPVLHTDVTNYCSLTTSNVWEQIGGYDEMYLCSICAEDSDFVRRARLLKNFKTIRSDLISFHQSHGGVTMYYNYLSSENQLKWDYGVNKAREYFYKWDKITYKNPQTWRPGYYGIKNIIVKNYG